MYNFSENKGRRKSRRLNSEVLLRTWPPRVQTQLNFIMRFKASFSLFLLETLNFLYWPISREKMQSCVLVLNSVRFLFAPLLKQRRIEKGQWTCSEFCQSTSPLSSSPHAEALQYDKRFKVFNFVNSRNKFRQL